MGDDLFLLPRHSNSIPHKLLVRCQVPDMELRSADNCDHKFCIIQILQIRVMHSDHLFEYHYVSILKWVLLSLRE